MALFLDVVCTDTRISRPERRENTVRVIGEILPFVIAKYGIGRVAGRAEDSRKSSDHPTRFNQSRFEV